MVVCWCSLVVLALTLEDTGAEHCTCPPANRGLDSSDLHDADMLPRTTCMCTCSFCCCTSHLICYLTPPVFLLLIMPGSAWLPPALYVFTGPTSASKC
jgi:hypothetical protein